jgi:hypothetical protein
MSQPLVFLATLTLRDTNEELVHMMRAIKHARESGMTNALCTLGGLNDDPREVWQIPEARAFFRRLVTTGFISYLDPLAALNPDPATHYLLRAGFGACEVWLASEGHDLSKPVTLTRPLLDELWKVLEAANAAADAALAG